MQYVFLFPGQGSQKVGMGQYLLAHSMGKQTFAEADEALGFSLSKMMQEGPMEELTKTFHAQPAILTVSVALARIFAEKGIHPNVMAGHSLGEYSALVTGGALSFADAVRAVHKRGQFMQDAVPPGVGTMSAVLGLDDQVVEEVCREVSQAGKLVEPANYNCPGQLVISGSVDGVAQASSILKEKGARRCIELPVSAPFHCSMLKPASQKMQSYLEDVQVHDLKYPYIANVDVDTVDTANDVLPRLVSQIDHPVRWTQTLNKLAAEYVDAVFIEVGDSKVMGGFMKKVNSEIKVHVCTSIEDVDQLCP